MRRAGTRIVGDLQQLVRDGRGFPPSTQTRRGRMTTKRRGRRRLIITRRCRWTPFARTRRGAIRSSGNAHLHLWTTNGFLRDAFRVIDAWGFHYKSCLVWIKSDIGMGNYWRVSHKNLLLAFRGKLTLHDRTLPSWVQADRTIHSRKPAVVRALIERVSPGPYLATVWARRAAGFRVDSLRQPNRSPILLNCDRRLDDCAVRDHRKE